MQESVSLYLDIVPGMKADIEIVSRASLAFSAAVKELIFVIDPSAEIRVELSSGTEGSLSLNTIIKSIRGKVNLSRNDIISIIVVVLSWFGGDIRSYVVSKLGDEFLSTEHNELSDDDIQKITDIVNKAVEGKVAQQHVKDVYRQLDQDPAVKGVGATQRAGERPSNIVPKEQFQQKIGTLDEVETTTTRTRQTIERVTLIRPVLVKGQRHWRFSFYEGEFGAPIKDEDFMEQFLSGRLQIAMAAGIEMDVELQTKEEKINGVWVVKERNILRIMKVVSAPTQTNLSFPPTTRQ